MYNLKAITVGLVSFVSFIACHLPKMSTRIERLTTIQGRSRPRSYLACLLVNQMKDGLKFRVPVDPIADTLSSQLACHNLQEVHFDRLLNKHHVILRHC
jgi:hypothetical protein